MIQLYRVHAAYVAFAMAMAPSHGFSLEGLPQAGPLGAVGWEPYQLGRCNIDIMWSEEHRIARVFLSDNVEQSGAYQVGRNISEAAGGSFYQFGRVIAHPAITVESLAYCINEGGLTGAVSNLLQDGANKSFSSDDYVGFSFEYDGSRFEFSLSGAANSELVYGRSLGQ